MNNNSYIDFIVEKEKNRKDKEEFISFFKSANSHQF